MRVLLLGSGGREHALAWKLAQSPLLTELHAAPGNPGIARSGIATPSGRTTTRRCSALRGSAVDLVVVGPEVPLVAGLADVLRSAASPFSGRRGARRDRGSKTFAKDVMAAAGVPTAATLRADSPCVLKADGLAAGKGVVVCHTQAEVEAGLEELEGFSGPRDRGAARGPGSVFALCDGVSCLALPVAQDFKRAYDDDLGPNTGGMGSFAPVPASTQGGGGPRRPRLSPVLAELA